jgi:Fe-S cluster assembly ATPase SufC
MRIVSLCVHGIAGVQGAGKPTYRCTIMGIFEFDHAADAAVFWLSTSRICF